MALIKCPECGGQVSDKAEVCIHCGYPLKNITEINQQETYNEENVNIHNGKINSENTEECKEENKLVDEEIPVESSKKKRKRRYTSFILVLVIGVLLVGGIYFYKNVYSPAHNYKQANELMKKGEYSEALEIFNDLGDYKNSKANILECEYQIAITQMQDESKLEFAKATFEQLVDYKDSGSYLEKCHYQLGMNYYHTGDFSLALDNLYVIQENYDVQIFIKNAQILEVYQGGWFNDISKYGISIDGWKMTRIFYKQGVDGKYRITSELEPEIIDESNLTESQIISYDYSKDGVRYDTILKIQNDKLYEDRGFDLTYEFERYDLSFDSIEEPKIGMTSEEVLNSTWGEPEDINKHTYSWGVKEQWCYPDNKYIYLEDGIVTSISE